jgi:hypothetical protein
MKTTKNTEDATGSAVPAVPQENPYLQPVANEQGTRPTNGRNGSVEADDEEAAALAELAAEEKKRKHRRHRRFAMALIGALLFASVVIAVAIYRQRSTRVEYGRAGNQPRVLAPPPNAGSTTGRDNRTKQAIDQMQQLTDENRSAGNANVQATTTGNDATNGANSNSTNTQADSSHPFVLSDSSDSSQSSTTSEKSSSTVSVTQNDQPQLRSQRSSETSLYVSERTEERSQPVSQNPERSSSTSAPAKESNTEAKIVVPPFGSMLPVRTIGGLYTLRSGALVRLELTRDIVGNGWSMTRGTILVGSTKGGEHDRAYVAIIGFIDPESGKFVKLGGDVLGGDGAAGLKGKSRQLDSRWTRVLSQLGNAAITLTSAALGGRSNGTVIISDGARSPLINPVSDELNGLIGAQSDRNRRTGFVEVVAGTPGYVMVTDLPATSKGTEANSELEVKGLATLSDIDAVRPATGISEREFAELISTGSPEEIKAKLHRMSPEMRKIALVVLQP